MYISKQNDLYVIYSIKGTALCAFRNLAIAAVCLRYLKGCAMTVTESTEARFQLAKWHFDGGDPEEVPDGE